MEDELLVAIDKDCWVHTNPEIIEKLAAILKRLDEIEAKLDTMPKEPGE